MTDYLSYLGLWGYVVDTSEDTADLSPDIGNYTTKTTVDSTTTTVVDNLRHSTDNRQWNKGNAQALATIQLRLADSIRSKYEDKTSTRETWEILTKDYPETTVPIIFAEFKKAIAFKLSGGDPAPEFATQDQRYADLDRNGCALSDFVRAMINVAVVPQKWETTVQQNFNVSGTEKLTLESVNKLIIAAHQNKQYIFN